MLQSRAERIWMSFIDSITPVRRFERRYAEHLVARFQSAALPGGPRVNLERELAPVRGLQEVLASVVGKPLLLLGEPGSGKSTALARIALVHARALAGSAG